MKPSTPLPWEQREDVFGHPYPYIVSIGTHTEAKDLVASCTDDNSDRGANDAAYIVEACNAYPKLMEEREMIRGVLEAIVRVAGNLSDASLETRTGPNDAASRGLMVVNARCFANDALKLMNENSLASLEKSNG